MTTKRRLSVTATLEALACYCGYCLLQHTSWAFVFSPICLSSRPVSSSWCNTRDTGSTFVLFASNKKRRKKNKQRSNNNGKGGGGGGFGNTNEVQESAPAMQSPKSAAAVEKLNAIFNLEEQETSHDKQEQESSKNSNEEEPENILESSKDPGDNSAKEQIESKNDPPEEEEDKEEESESAIIELVSNDDKDDKDETALLMARYTEEYQQEVSSHNQQKRKKQLVQVSESPLIFTIDEFIDPELCRKIQNDATGCYDLLYPEQLADNLFNGQESELDGLLFNKASSLEHTKNEPYPDGLHMDTNNQCLNRHITCILYLNDVPEECGGATVFPIARSLPDDPALDASRRLLKEQISHTRRQISKWSRSKQDAKLLETRVGTDFPNNPQTSTAIKIQPKAGKLLVFFSRDSNGQEDPRAWHAGERLKPPAKNNINNGSAVVVAEKRILTLFKEVDYNTNGRDDGDDNNDESNGRITTNNSPLEEYLAPMVSEQRQWLQAKARLQRAILEYSGSDEESSTTEQ